MLIVGNVFRDIFGWTYISEKRGRWSGGIGSDVQGMGGRGLYVDFASGLHAYRNIAYNNALAGFSFYGTWRDGALVFYNNVAANGLHGFRLVGMDFDTHGSADTQLINNVLVNNEGYGILQEDLDGEYGNFILDNNLYYQNGWRAFEDGGVWNPGAMAVFIGAAPNEYYQTLADIQSSTLWESHGIEGDPGFWDYDPGEHNLHDSSWPDFHISSASFNVVD